MAQLFRPSANFIVRVSIVLILVFTVAALCALDYIHKSPAVRYTHIPREQPTPYSHTHHVNLGLDCRYCHTSVEDSSFANIPPTRVCMNCHTVIATNKPTLEAVRNSWETGESLEWVRVTDLPDHVYFNHSIHVAKGVGCVTCHGNVSEMHLTWKEKPLFMKWCLECHRQPEKFLRPKEEVTNLDYVHPDNQLEVGARLLKEYNIDKAALTDCWICHR